MHAWMVQNGAWKDGRRGHMHGWYSMVHGRMGGVEGACMDGTVWCMEGWWGGERVHEWMVQYGAWKDGRVIPRKIEVDVWMEGRAPPGAAANILYGELIYLIAIPRPTGNVCNISMGGGGGLPPSVSRLHPVIYLKHYKCTYYEIFKITFVSAVYIFSSIGLYFEVPYKLNEDYLVLYICNSVLGNECL